MTIADDDIYIPPIEEEGPPDDSLDRLAEREERESSGYSLPMDSELRKPWKEMNPLIAIEEAKLLPLPQSYSRLSIEEVYDRLADMELAEGMPGFEEAYKSLTRPLCEPLTDEQIKIGLTRCPYCRSGHIKRGGVYRECPCCRGFIFVGTQTILGFSESLNEVRETDRIDKAMKEIVKKKKVGRKKKAEEETKESSKVIDLFGEAREIPAEKGKGRRK